MVLTPRLDQRQSQSLVMTPQLQQAIKLLQLSNLEVTAFVEQELERNPLLEREDENDEDAWGTESAEGADEDGGEGRADDDGLDPIDFDPRADDVEIPDEAGYDVDYDNIYNNAGAADPGHDGMPPDLSLPSSGGARSFDDGIPDLEQTLSESATLRDHLAEQLAVELDGPADRLIGQYLIDLVDEAGYVPADLGQAADVLGCPTERVEAVLARLQDFDPPGIFARDLKECLSLQLKERDRLDPAMATMLDHLDLVAGREHTKLARACGVDLEDIADMVDEIRSLNPKPAVAFDHEPTQSVTPDVLMRAQPGGGWFLELNSETLPRVLVNNHYYSRISGVARTREERHYITEQLHSANWLVKALHQRATTILKVAGEIVRQQEAFFTRGVEHLRPLVLRDIADAVEMHESTISRVTTNKHIATPRGIFELKYFFSSALASRSGGDAHSAESVRHRIRALIDAEDPKKILSDDKIAEILQAEGIDVARRTVAKYRESLGILSSVQRRREKSAPR